MASKGSKVIASEINALYTRLNVVRKNHSLATLSRSIATQTPTYSSQMTTLKSDLDSTASSSKFITTKSYDLGEIGVGKPISSKAYAVADSAISSFETVCVHNSVQSHDGSDDSQHGAVGDYSKHGDNSVQSNNSNDGKCSYDGRSGYGDTCSSFK